MRTGDTHLQPEVSRRRGEEGREEGAGTHQQAKCLIGASEDERLGQKPVGKVWVSEEIEAMSLVVSVWRRRRRGRSQEWW